MATKPERFCADVQTHDAHDWVNRDAYRDTYRCPGIYVVRSRKPTLSNDPADTVANSIAIGTWMREKDEALRELLSYCRGREEYKGRANDIGADTAYGDVADKLAAILDGE